AVSTSVKGALVRIDDTAHGPAPLTVELPVGRHRVEAASEGFRSTSAEVLVRKGERETVTLELEPLPAAPKMASPTEPPVQAQPRTTPVPPRAEVNPTLTAAPRTRSSLPWVTLGVGAAAGAAGTFFMLQAGDRHRQLIDPNGPTLTTDREHQLVQEGSAFQTYGLVGLGVGAAVATTGLAWLLLRGGDADELSVVTPTANGLTWVGVW
ncbi:MAG: PEGA domain-containing protein, partial [Myxococcota bacterium]